MKNFKIKTFTAFMAVMVTMTVLLTGCSKNSGTIKIATKPMTEQFILSEMLSLLIKDNTNLNVEITKGIGGGTSNIHPAIVKGDFDLYPEYTGTGWSEVLKEKELPDKDTLYKELKEKYEEQYKLTWVGLYGFNNTYGLAVRKDIAEKYNIKSYSDLVKYAPELNFGAEYDFYEREDGYNALCSAYGFKFKKTSDMDIGLKYKAINSKEIDVMNVFTTDGQLSASEVVVIKDDKNFFQTYYCGTVIREDTLEKYPELKDVLMKMQDIVTDSEMAKLNYEVETNGRDEKDVAKEFLESKGLLKK